MNPGDHITWDHYLPSGYLIPRTGQVATEAPRVTGTSMVRWVVPDIPRADDLYPMVAVGKANARSVLVHGEHLDDAGVVQWAVKSRWYSSGHYASPLGRMAVWASYAPNLTAQPPAHRPHRVRHLVTHPDSSSRRPTMTVEKLTLARGATGLEAHRPDGSLAGHVCHSDQIGDVLDMLRKEYPGEYAVWIVSTIRKRQGLRAPAEVVADPEGGNEVAMGEMSPEIVGDGTGTAMPELDEYMPCPATGCTHTQDVYPEDQDASFSDLWSHVRFCRHRGNLTVEALMATVTVHRR